MPRVELTSHLRRHLDLEGADVAASTIREALDTFLARDPRARSYVFDEQSSLRRHVIVFVDGTIVDRRALDAAIDADSVLTIMQALSGGRDG